MRVRLFEPGQIVAEVENLRCADCPDVVKSDPLIDACQIAAGRHGIEMVIEKLIFVIPADGGKGLVAAAESMVEAQDEGSHPDLPGRIGHIVAYGIPRFQARGIRERDKFENLPGNGTHPVGADDVEHAVALNLLAESKGRVGNLLAALDNSPPLIHGRRIINLDRDAHALSPNHLGGEGFSEISLAFEFGGY